MMSRSSIGQHFWSLWSCFSTVKHNKNKIKVLENRPINRSTIQYNGENNKNTLEFADDKSNILCKNKNDILSDKNTLNIHNDENNLNDNGIKQQTDNDINSKTINQKVSLTLRSKQLDAIVEDSNEEDLDATLPAIKFFSDRDLINDSNTLYSRLFDLSQKSHIVIQFNNNVYLLDEFTRQLDKLKCKIDDVQRVSNEIPRDAELLEARYSTLVSTIETLSIILKVSHISSSRSLFNRLLSSIEQRMEQLNKLIQLSLSASLRQKYQDFNEDDLLSFRSALSSYEQLLSISS